MRRAMVKGRTWLGACLALVAVATVPAQHPVASPLPRFTAPPVVRGAFDAPDDAPQPPADAQSQLARTFNAAVPLAGGVIIAAQPFYLRAAPEDLARATDCLAAADYYEAGLGIADQRAVAQVVLNRVRHRAFPASVCGVVFQGSERRTGCQFTFTCDGSLLRRTPSAEAWQQSRRVATEMLLGQVDPTVGLATHYHTDWVSPAWDRTMDKIAVVRTHLFYRWRGTQVFEMRHTGSEPDIAMLARISDAHRAATVGSEAPQLQFLPVIPTGQPPLTAPTPPAAPRSGLGSVLAAPPPNVFLVTLPAGGTPASFRAMAEQRCAGVSQCRFIGWTDAARTPRALPMPGSSVDAITFIFERRSTATAPENLRWDCTRFAPEGTGHCI
ncbi:SleB-like protein [Sphingomonas sp. LH128]|uniref:cell wall hydrolase n=1 Tax=Sphingomonas sp. LH128 TaxID=473781 RepID=UPI00027CBF3B|nr:cell wall hydrolase [Sphingomonas sp. LH128]EJU14357.1 SleB-like protein [Sphingomonas sp. LH128]